MVVAETVGHTDAHHQDYNSQHDEDQRHGNLESLEQHPKTFRAEYLRVANSKGKFKVY